MRICSVVGARPQFIKLCPFLRAVAEHNSRRPAVPVQDVLIHTGQHYDDRMSRVFFEELGLKEPDYRLGVGSGTHGWQTGEIVKRVEGVLLKEQPHLMVVFGDTNSTIGGALAAAKLHIPVAHVEAGLRSFNRQMPEEINRVLTDHVSHWLFCPTQTAVRNLEREGITKGVHFVGDIMYDATLQNSKLAERHWNVFQQLKLEPKCYALATLHRAENTDDPTRLASLIEALDAVANHGLPVILPLHPRTRKQIDALGLSAKALRVTEPVSYLTMLLLEQQARVIFTDSGGVQKEAFFLGVPCITLRDETEWVETLEEGWNRLAGSQPRSLAHLVRSTQRLSVTQPVFGEGDAAQRIVTIIAAAKL